MKSTEFLIPVTIIIALVSFAFELYGEVYNLTGIRQMGLGFGSAAILGFLFIFGYKISQQENK